MKSSGALLASAFAALFYAACAISEKSAPEPEPMPPGRGGDAGPLMPKGPPPSFGPTVTADKAPPALSGGTLLIAGDGVTAIASDPDRDVVFLVDLVAKEKLAEIAVRENDEPGRAVEDGDQRVHVALRRGGAIVTIDLATRKELARRNVCPAPRGIAYDAANDSIHVACLGGELVTLPAAGGAATRTLDLGRDLRDVVVIDGKLFVSHFRSARLVRIGDDGKPQSDAKPRAIVTKPEGAMSPGVAWRISPTAGRIGMVHQLGKDGAIDPAQPGGYGGAGGGVCGGIVQTAVTFFGDSGPLAEPTPIALAVLPVDLAFDATGEQVAILAAGNAKNGLFQVITLQKSAVRGPCAVGTGGMAIAGEATAVAYLPDGALVVQSREPAFVEVWRANAPTRIQLSEASRADTGHAIFHANSGAGIACASCHPEGSDDARTWSFAGLGPRRTQTFRGGILGSEPLHWDGDMKDLKTLMDSVFVGRMAGPLLRDDQHLALTKWIDRIPELPVSPPGDPAAADRGKALFADTTVGCASCHSGPRLSNNASVNVGTGRALQVPSLRGLAFRAPYLHTGCANTLLDRFGACGGGDDHGKTSHLTPAQLADLVTYLETL